MTFLLLYIVAAILAYAPWQSARTGRRVHTAVMLIASALGVAAAIHGAHASIALALVNAVAFLAALAGVSTLQEDDHGTITNRQARLYQCMLPLFVLAMNVTLLADNLGVAWMALEATTLATLFLVSFSQKDGAHEAAWKYFLLCSTGIAIGFVALIAVAAAHVSVQYGLPNLRFSTLLADANALSPGFMRFAFILALIGFGTKVGFAPMHTWLPDAHSKTPSPISGLLSGVLLTVAFTMILRVKALTDLALGNTSWTGNWLLIFGTLSVVVAAFFLLHQKNYKRMLAYSSIEHMGLAAIAFGLGPVGAAAGTVHLVGHAFAKSGLFFGAGEILHKTKTTTIDGVKDFAKQAPKTAALFTLLLLALLAAPPSALFASEWYLFGALFETHPWLGLLLLPALSMVAFGMLSAVFRIWYSGHDVSSHDGATGHEGATVSHHPEAWNLTHLAMILALVAVVAVGVYALRDPNAVQLLSLTFI